LNVFIIIIVYWFLIVLTYLWNKCPGIIKAMVAMTEAISSCQGQRSPCKNSGMTERAEEIIPQMVFGRKWRIMPVMKQPKPQSKHWYEQ
jgi:hypothetical protein